MIDVFGGHPVTSKVIQASRIEIRTECFGPYNRRAVCWTEHGMVEGVLRDTQVAGLPVGRHSGPFLIQVYETIYGMRLVEGVLGPVAGEAREAKPNACAEPANFNPPTTLKECEGA